MTMDGSVITIFGRVATAPTLTAVGSAEKATFRVVSTERYRDKDRVWQDGDQFGVSVVCWRSVAAGVRDSIRKGDPVVVAGRIIDRSYTDADGLEHWITEVKADVLGLDVARMRGRLVHIRPDAEEQPASELPPASGFDAPDFAGPEPDAEADERVLDALAAAAEPLVPIS